MNTKTVYSFDLAGLFTTTSDADESPMEPGIFLLPARTTENAPPAVWPDDMWPRWNGFGWELISKPDVTAPPTAAQKLAQFLAENPDVMGLIDGGANV